MTIYKPSMVRGRGPQAVSVPDIEWPFGVELGNEVVKLCMVLQDIRTC